MTSRPQSSAHPASISVVIPIHDEVENLERLVAALDASVPPLGREYEYVLVDDGSTDGSTDLLDQLAAGREDIVPVHLRRCFGQTAALDAGIRTSRGDVIVLLDADLQNDPADIPLMLVRLDDGYDVVHGWRASRQDRFWSRRLPSVVANRLIRWVTGVKVHDLGCAIRVIRRELAEELPLEGDMHRFIAVLADARGARSCEVPVRHHARTHGRSKYGLSRTLKVAADLVVLSWFTRLSVPMVRLAIAAGLALMACAALIPLVTAIVAVVRGGVSWGMTGLAVLACVAGGLQLIGLGLVAATASSAWWRTRGVRPWSIRGTAPSDHTVAPHSSRRAA
jgi:hypothetical protein